MMDFGWDRLAYAAALSRRTGLPLLISSESAEARRMAMALRKAFGIEARWVDLTARDTFANASNSADLLRGERFNRIALVTHSSHMRRAVEEFEAAGLDVAPAPVVVNLRPHPGLRAWVPDEGAFLYTNAGLTEIVGGPVARLLRRWRS